MKYTYSYPIEDLPKFKKKTLVWAKRYSHFSFLENNSFQYPNEAFRNLFALGAKRLLRFEGVDSFEILKNDVKKNKSWLFGYFGYELKNEIENLQSNNAEFIKNPPIYFYEPEYVVEFFEDKIIIFSDNANETLFENIQKVELEANLEVNLDKKEILNTALQQKISKQDYCKTIEKIRTNIVNGDVYELNFCMEFFAQNTQINPLQIFTKLNAKSPMPFAAFQKINEQYLICASPERFLKKVGQKLISQPIKGTIGRGKTAQEDEKLKKQLFNDEKERAENMMIVDLVRNDLARSSEIGSTKVSEMFGIYTFEQLHQMISTVESKLHKKVHFVDAIKNAFPMGSMTGAPKIAAMKLIEEYEQSQRGVYSGAMGYISPQGDFDFNVVIRSILYDSNKQIMSFQVGGAITYDSVPEKEYQECLLKAKAIFEVLFSSPIVHTTIHE